MATLGYSCVMWWWSGHLSSLVTFTDDWITSSDGRPVTSIWTGFNQVNSLMYNNKARWQWSKATQEIAPVNCWYPVPISWSSPENLEAWHRHWHICGAQQLSAVERRLMWSIISNQVGWSWPFWDIRGQWVHRGPVKPATVKWYVIKPNLPESRPRSSPIGKGWSALVVTQS